MLSVYDTANYFAQKENPISGIKCQILCYYAQAWSLAFDDKPLMNEKFKTGIYGPESDSLNELFKSKNMTQFDQISADIFSGKANPITDDNHIELLSALWGTYGKYDRFDLETLVKQEIPYTHARRGYPDTKSCQNIISENVTKVFYRALSKIYDIEDAEEKQRKSG